MSKDRVEKLFTELQALYDLLFECFLQSDSLLLKQFQTEIEKRINEARLNPDDDDLFFRMSGMYMRILFRRELMKHFDLHGTATSNKDLSNVELAYMQYLILYGISLGEREKNKSTNNPIQKMKDMLDE